MQYLIKDRHIFSNKFRKHIVASTGDQSPFLGGCQGTDVSPSAAACYGFFDGNVNGNSPDMQSAQATALSSLGLSGPYNSTSLTVTGDSIFSSLALNGTTYISLHWGKGNGPVDTQGGGTAFYRLELGANENLKQFTSNWGSLSNAVLWSTEPPCRDCEPPPGVPEPATWAMMILGFGGVGAVTRRRRAGMSAA